MGGGGGQFGNFSIRKFPAVISRATLRSLRTDRDGSLMSHRHLIFILLVVRMVMLMVMLVIVMMVTMLAMSIADVKDKKVVAQRKA